eukprot:3046601-Pleurochrysis_carterae.AAC.4
MAKLHALGWPVRRGKRGAAAIPSKYRGSVTFALRALVPKAANVAVDVLGTGKSSRLRLTFVICFY